MIWLQARCSSRIRRAVDLHEQLIAIDWRRRLDAAVRTRRVARGVA